MQPAGESGIRGIPETRRALEQELVEKDRARERLIAASRDIVRASSSAIASMVRGEDPAPQLQIARGSWGSARPSAQEHQDVAATGPLENALQELAEAEILFAILGDRPLPTPRSLRVPASSYVMGLADCIGELRRLALNSLGSGKPDLARHRLVQMETLDDLLSQMHFPSGVVPVKKKQDVARGLIERTRGEVVLGALMARKDATPEQLREALATSGPGASRPRTPKPDITRPGTTKPGITKPGITRPVTTRPGIIAPRTQGPTAPAPRISSPGTSAPPALRKPTSETPGQRPRRRRRRGRGRRTRRVAGPAPAKR